MKFIKNYPALLIPEINALVIADLHIGVSYELYKSGINIPSQVTSMKNSIDRLIDKTKAQRLIINGDIKHEVPGISYQEMREVPEFLRHLSHRIKVDLVTGNHDTFIKELQLEGVEIHDTRGFRIGRFSFNHGHTWPSKELLMCDYLIIAHTHPTVQFTDKFGYRIVEPVWIKSRINKEKIRKRYKLKKTGRLEIIIMPAFNQLLGGTPINVRRKKNELLGPLLKNNFLDIKNAELYLLDGTYLGNLKNIIDST
jgi:hypothetical protein